MDTPSVVFICYVMDAWYGRNGSVSGTLSKKSITLLFIPVLRPSNWKNLSLLGSPRSCNMTSRDRISGVRVSDSIYENRYQIPWNNYSFLSFDSLSCLWGVDQTTRRVVPLRPKVVVGIERSDRSYCGFSSESGEGPTSLPGHYETVRVCKQNLRRFINSLFFYQIVRS